MRVEPATLSDVDRVVELWIALATEQEQFGSHLYGEANREPIRMTMASHVVDDGVYVARNGDDVVGFVSFEVASGGFVRSVTRGIIQNVYVESGARNAGVGSALLDAAEAELRDRGVDTIAIEAMADNEAARRLYRRRGYRPHRVEYERSAKSDTHSREDG